MFVPDKKEGHVLTRIRFIFQYLTKECKDDDKNTFLIFLDGEKILENVVDARTRLGGDPDSIVQVPEGRHTLRFMLVEKDLEKEVVHDFNDDVGFYVYLNVGHKDLMTGKFEFW